MGWHEVKDAFRTTFFNLDRNHTLMMAAALSYYFVLSLFPALIFLSTLLAYLPVPDLFSRVLNLISQFLPADGMRLIRRVLTDVISPHRGSFLSVSMLGLLWAASSGVSAAMEALNVAYDVTETRPYWKARLFAIWLTFIIGGLLVIALAVMLVGPRFGDWLSATLHFSGLLTRSWPLIHWLGSFLFAILAIEILYSYAPNLRRGLLAALPGACLAVVGWMILSLLLGVYFRHLAHLSKTYGALGAGVALLVWFYWSGVAILAGARLNSELQKKPPSEIRGAKAA